MAFKNGGLSDLVGRGENPNGFISQGPNGTHRNGEGADGDQWMCGPEADGPRWARKSPSMEAMSISVASMPAKRAR